MFAELNRIIPTSLPEFADLISRDAIRSFVKATEPDRLRVLTAELNRRHAESEQDSYEVEAAMMLAGFKVM